MAHALFSSNPSSAYSFPSTFRRNNIAVPRRLIVSSSPFYRRRPSVAGAMGSSNTNSPDLNRATSEKGWKKSSAGPVRCSGAWFSIPVIPVWARWALGTLVIVAIPFSKRMLRIEGKIAEVAEDALEVVEKVAEVAEKIASDVADALPQGASLKEKALLIEQIAHDVDKDAKIAEAIIHEIDHIKEEVDTLVKPTVEKGEQTEQEIHVASAKESTEQPKAD